MPEQNEIPWVIQEQTKVKHQLLNRYIDPWMTILFRAQASLRKPERVVYIDGFSGPGDYWSDESRNSLVPGSPIIVANIANKYIEEKESRRVDVVAIDSDSRCIERLKPQLASTNKHGQNWIANHISFEEAVTNLINDSATGYLQNPTFVFIDPFGYSGYPLDSLRRILAYPRTELFINFMIYFIVRFLNEPHAQNALKELYGGDDYLKAKDIANSDEKAEFLINLFCEQLRNKAGAKYTLPFRINTPGQGERPLYYLIHVSTNFKALKVMKDEMAKTSQEEYKFVAIGLDEDNQMSLFRNPAEVEIENSIVDFVKKSRQVSYEVLEEWAYVYTPAVSKKIKELLVKLEIEKKLDIQRKPRQKANTVTEGALISVGVTT